MASGYPRISSDAQSDSRQIGMLAAVSIGIGGMVGAGIFSILGVVAQATGNTMGSRLRSAAWWRSSPPIPLRNSARLPPLCWRRRPLPG
jgi:hypothetical protein